MELVGAVLPQGDVLKAEHTPSVSTSASTFPCSMPSSTSSPRGPLSGLLPLRSRASTIGRKDSFAASSPRRALEFFDAVNSAEVGQEFQLPEPLPAASGTVKGAEVASGLPALAGGDADFCCEGALKLFTHVRVASKTRQSTRVLLGCVREAYGGEKAAPESSNTVVDFFHEFEIRRLDIIQEVAVMAILRMLNEQWDRVGVAVCGVRVAARTYQVLPLCASVGLVEVVTGSVSLGDLKRKSIKGDVTERVTEHLGNNTKKLARLAATTAAFLASSFILGAAGGDGDSLMLIGDGTLFRVDFNFIFGRQATLAGVPFDAPAVWLPRAVTTALGSMWADVQMAAIEAFRIGAALLSPSPPLERAFCRPWGHAQGLLLCVERALQLPASWHLVCLCEADLTDALHVADCAISKRLKTFLHETFSYRSRAVPGRASLSLGDDSTRLLLHGLDLWPGCFSESTCDAWGDVCLTVAADAWILGMIVVAFFCTDSCTGALLFQSVLWKYLQALARDTKDGGLQPQPVHREAVIAVASLLRHASSHANAWIVKMSSIFRWSVIANDLAKRLHEIWHRLPSFPPSESPAPLDADLLQMAMGAICAVVRMDAAASNVQRTRGQNRNTSVATAVHSPILRPLGGSTLQENYARDESFLVNLGSARALMQLAKAAFGEELEEKQEVEEDIMIGSAAMACRSSFSHNRPSMHFRGLLEGLVSNMSGKDFVAASRGMGIEERLAALGTVDRLLRSSPPLRPRAFIAPDSSRCTVRRWSQACLTVWASDEDPAMRRAAVCAIGCAVDDVHPEVRRWARCFLTSAALKENDSRTVPFTDPVSALVRLSSKGVDGAAACDACCDIAETVIDDTTAPQCRGRGLTLFKSRKSLRRHTIDDAFIAKPKDGCDNL
eukprot:TRINITY_DN15363_c0_g2_i1.p1 TRINITY_DN15363_c0_g2~~TRINITY_DN15363_c0_g2_i1.p1  ORF type:complete len:896 (+),score=135.47 TRINITY_DN15363_c0_g2_i1:138-2825(+)